MLTFEVMLTWNHVVLKAWTAVVFESRKSCGVVMSWVAWVYTGVCCFGKWLLIAGLRMVVAEAGSGRDGCSCWLNLGHFGAWIC